MNILRINFNRKTTSNEMLWEMQMQNALKPNSTK